MSLLFNGSIMVAATPEDVWPKLVDWTGQGQWIPMTTMQAIGRQVEGLGTRIRGRHGPSIGGRRLGFSDEMVVTCWEPPYELEMTHLGPWFTGVGVFTIEARGLRTWLSVRERITVRGGKVAEKAALAFRPLLQRQLADSLQRFVRLVADNAPRPTELTDPARRYLSRRNKAPIFADEAEKRQRRQQRRRVARS
ncbi:SRPBCC family protein [Microlunatus elymi]|uniref:SRPBCC family protein n=1 Tax=Microlunatus elymi TaxID=2596828 RepID=A0A516Q327_9ACTN|nr:SRPBCC family protein [Microlunatus elymi]QDP97835.1 SRPBCC family protein [Microlunatus elymi]